MRRFPALVLLCLLALIGPAAVDASASDPSGDPDGLGELGADRYAPLGTVQGTKKPQTSDGVIGEIAPDSTWLPPALERRRLDSAILREWDVVPGVHAVVWDEKTSRGPIRAYLLTIDLRAPGVGLDYVNAGPVKRTADVMSMVKRDRAVAGVNGDFFDIGDTGAPLGIGKDLQRGLLNGRLNGWNSAFYVTRQGHVKIGPLEVRSRIKGRPKMLVTNYNSASVQPNRIGLYTSAWGYTSGYQVVDGQRKKVRMVLVRRGRVVKNSVRLPHGSKIDGTLLIGRGAGAQQLATLKRGARVRLTTAVTGSPRMAITGNKFLIRDGLIEVVDDREMHPRTAIGIDRETHSVLLLVIDGRQSFSRGYTMVELANKMIELGADEALNLDGGGSSTMIARSKKAGLEIVNSPSDGFMRRVANGIAVTYTPPKNAQQGR